MRVGADSRGGRLISIRHTGLSTDRTETVVQHCKSSPDRGRNIWLQNLANTKVRGGMAEEAMFGGRTSLAIGRCACTGSE